MPRKRHFSGGWVHKIVGDRIFDPALWKMTTKSFRSGLVLGTIIAFSPTIGFQMLLGAVMAYIFRVNMPATIIACWITNPITVPIIYPMEYSLGAWLNGLMGIEEFTRTGSGFHFSMTKVMHVVTGSLIFSAVGGLVVYGVVYFLLEKLQIHKVKEKISESKKIPLIKKRNTSNGNH